MSSVPFVLPGVFMPLGRFFNRSKNRPAPEAFIHMDSEGEQHQGLPPKTRNNTTTLVVCCVLVLCLMTILAVTMKGASDKQVDANLKVIGWGGSLFGIIVVLLKLDNFIQYQHDQNHRSNNDRNKIALATTETKKKAEKLEEKNDEFQKEVRGKLNGGLHNTVKEELKNCLPQTLEEWTKFVLTTVDCSGVAKQAGREVLEQAIKEGLLVRPPFPSQPPQDPPQ